MRSHGGAAFRHGSEQRRGAPLFSRKKGVRHRYAARFKTVVFQPDMWRKIQEAGDVTTVPQGWFQKLF
ncbi:hypothetical protein DENIS_4275 [Desulfonema ishimotonii]|uniref:Uncharacterized protein n=1 Tax=Desulfonema ishimotonii TaxID=45657 RepID=A0A401G286_9BACT|nr:hypothetical protein DENIS_4275 [Desulfonema ishimotonii]